MTLHANPVAGDDSLATGSGTARGAANPACAFRTITRAMAAASAAAKQRMTVLVDVTATASAGTNEVFPITVPANTTISAAAGAVVTVQVASGDGFLMLHDSSAIEALKIDGQGSAAHGIVVSAGSAAGPNVLSDIEVMGFASAGVRADKTATLTITAGANVHDNGSASAPAGGPGPAGLLALESAVVTVNGAGATEQRPTQFSSNSGNGIEVRGQAQVNISGALSQLTPGAGTVVVKSNSQAGVYVEQLLVAAGTSGPAGMTMTGLVSTLNGADGLHLFGGSGVKVRASYLSRNSVHGVHIQTDPAFIGGGAGANDGNDLSRLDFGGSGDFGHNILQDAANPNTRKGLCLELTSGNSTGGLLKARGNVFATGGISVDCSQIAGSLPATGDCTAEGPLGDAGRNPKNDFDVAQCTVP
jgi:hypothetical protein